MRNKGLTRRSFLKGSAAAVAGGMAAPYLAGAQARRVSPMERLNIAAIGSGGRGRANLNGCRHENIVALCDIDSERAADAFETWPDAARYEDFRQMLDEMANDIDAVLVSTPDHTHAVAALACIEAGKHVYVEKPLTHNIWEARKLTEAAREHGVVTQMGNQGHAGEGVRQLCEMIWSGAIGQVREAHIWTNRPVWPQGIDRPEEVEEVPDHLNWDLFLGPAPERPYNSIYHPFNWRGWWDFGTGALGDMACHIMDPAFWALNLKYPESVEVVRQEGATDETGPNSSVIKYEFAARGSLDPVTVYWYDGGEMPEPPVELGEDEHMGDGNNGTFFVGDDGILTCGEYGGNPRFMPEALMDDYEMPPQVLPRSAGVYTEWIQACKGGPLPLSNFDYSGPFTEMVLLGNLALRTDSLIEWDGPNLQVTNNDAANDMVKGYYRDGWEI